VSGCDEFCRFGRPRSSFHRRGRNRRSQTRSRRERLSWRIP
jgi:hypothetical protein